jgi:DeoR/GlpR family transcriptional regulator of sugar metabolism
MPATRFSTAESAGHAQQSVPGYRLLFRGRGQCAQGATCFNLEELPVKHWALNAAQYHVLVVDHSKFGKVRPARMGDLARLT